MKNSDNIQTPEPSKCVPQAEKSSEQEQLYQSAPWAVSGAIASSVAHEINNPLTAVLGFSSALLERINKNEEIDRKDLASYLQIIHDEAIRCHRIMDNFHRFAGESAAKKDGSASLLDTVASALSLVGMKAARAEVTFVNKLVDERRVRADAVRLEQVFVSLFVNRTDCCSPGTTVTISAPAGARESNLQTASVIIRDNSAVMKAGTPDMFFIVKGKEKRVGVGLGFCRRAVEDLRGRFEYDIKTGEGTTIRIDVPADTGPEDRRDL